MATPHLKGKISMDDSAAMATLRRFQGAATRSISGINGAFGRLGGGGPGGALRGGIGGLTGVLSGAAFANGVNNAIKMGGELRNLGKATGIAVGELYMLKGVFNENEKSSEEMGAALSRMQAQIANGKGFDDLAVDLERIKGLRASEQFQEIGKAILAIPDPSKRVAAARDVFGKSGASLMSVFEDVSKMDLSKLSKVGQMLERDAEKLDQTGDAMTRVEREFQGFSVAAASSLADAINEGTGKVDENKFIKMGESAGSKIGTGIRNILNPQWWRDTGEAAKEMLKGNYAKADEIRARAGQGSAASPGATPAGAHVVSSGTGWGRLEGFKSFVDPVAGNRNGPGNENALGATGFQNFFGGGIHGYNTPPTHGEMGRLMSPAGGGVGGMSKPYGQTQPKSDDEDKPLNKDGLREVMEEFWGK